MVNPILKKLSCPRLSAAEIATLLEKHIGSGSNETHCVQAIEAISRIKSCQIRGVAKAVNLLLMNNGPPCERIGAIISHLRSAINKP